jgi:hypothetical protein
MGKNKTDINFPKPEMKDRREEILQLIEKTDENTKNEILLEVLLANDNLIEKLKTKAADLESSPGNKTISELMEEFYKSFTEIEMLDEEEAMERCNDDHDYYQEEWEMIEEVQQQDLEDQTEYIFDDIEDLIQTGRFLEAVQHCLALKEALEKYNDDEKECKNFPSGESLDLFRDYFSEKLLEIYELLSKQIMKEETQEKILETIFDRYKKPDFEEIPFYLLNKLLTSIPFNKKPAAQLLKITQQKEYLTKTPETVNRETSG